MSFGSFTIDWKVVMGIPAMVVAIITMWVLIGLPRPATSADISRLDRQQAETAVEVYSTKVRSLILLQPQVNDQTAAGRAWKEELDNAREQLKRAEQRKIELSK